jgi:PTH1 family peptidyl-tRNA hydrolase
MFLIVGLGNPGKKYEGNRHNAGFMAVDALVRAENLPDFKEKFSGVWTKGTAYGQDVAVLKPMTYMNLSGDSVQPASAFLKVPLSNLIVLHDEVDLPWGDVRLKQGGGHAGNNGIRSIIERLGSPDFLRVRIGIGRPGPGFRGEMADYVLQDFDAMERAELPDVLGRALKAVELVLREGVAAAMNAVNSRPKPKSAPKTKS